VASRDRALDRAVRALAHRDHSTASLAAKLERAGFSEEERTDALDALVRAGYLDDARFAQARAAHLAARGYGDEWIRGDLESQGVGSDAIGDALGGLAPEETRARDQAARLGDPARAAKTLQRRGFSEDALERVLAGPLRTTPEQE
jgi:regulatory protein